MTRPLRRDVLLAGAFAAALVLEVGTSSTARGDFVPDAVIYGAAGLTMMFRRVATLPAVAACMALVTLGTVTGTHVQEMATSLLVLVLPTYAVGHEVEERRAYLGLAICVAGVVAVTIAAEDVSLATLGFPLGAQVAAFTAGRLLRNRLLLTRTLADEAARLELERAHRAEAAAGEERARIAREMHDVVAHTMAIMVVQAGAARSVLARDPARAEAALATVEETGRTALAELRRMLGFLREDAPAERAPQPGLGEVRGLVARAREAGLRVELREQGDRFGLPSGAELAAYRIVQEALTNTLKHAGPGTLATVTLQWQPDGLEIAVIDGGGDRGTGEGTGHGLAGMRERMAMYGGDVEARPRPDGGFAVRARLPREDAGTAPRAAVVGR
jgi:signal transduction histidine kinase